MKKDIKHIFWMLLCLFTIVACSDENHEMLITGPEIPELDHEPSIEELVEGINNYPTKFKGDKQGKIWYKAAAGDDLYGYEGDVYVHIGINDWMYVPTEWGVNEDKYKAEKVADNIWCFTLAPTVREWFGAENAANIQNVCIRHFNALHQLADDEVIILHRVILQSFDDVRHLGAHVGIRLQYSIAFLPFFQFVLDCI